MNIKSIDNINFYWKQIFHALKKLSKSVLEELNLTKVDANILLALSRTKEKTKAELAEYLSFEPNSLTRSIDRLIEINLINRVVDKKDRRFIKLSLTKEGRKTASQYIKAMRNIWLKILKNMVGRQRLELWTY